MPARRFGKRLQKSTSQRLCARMPGEAVLVVLGLRRRREQHEAREERRHGVREDHLADDAVGVLLAVAHLVVPVAQPTVVARREVLVGVAVLVAPRVEVVEVLLLEVLAVLRVAPTGVGVGRDDRVAVVRSPRSQPSVPPPCCRNLERSYTDVHGCRSDEVTEESSEDRQQFRAEAQAWLAEHAPGRSRARATPRRGSASWSTPGTPRSPGPPSTAGVTARPASRRSSSEEMSRYDRAVGRGLGHRHGHDRADDPRARHRRAEGTVPAADGPATTSGASCSASPAPAPTSPG